MSACLDAGRASRLEDPGGPIGLKEPVLEFTTITDAGLEHIKGMTNLRGINIGGTQVADAGVAALKKALPNCTIIK